jgi:hypothetical protein
MNQAAAAVPPQNGNGWAHPRSFHSSNASGMRADALFLKRPTLHEAARSVTGDDGSWCKFYAMAGILEDPPSKFGASCGSGAPPTVWRFVYTSSEGQYFLRVPGTTKD